MTVRILAVDDSRTMRNLLDAALRPAGYQMYFAEDGCDGLDRLAEADPHLVITDINMPRMDGFGFIEEMRRRSSYRGVPILVLTTESSPDLKQRARSAGATGWIVKPFDEEKLIAVIERVVAA